MDEKSEIVKHYRVDKIKHLNIEKAKRNGESIFQNFDMEKFSAGTFGMFGGKKLLSGWNLKTVLLVWSWIVLDRMSC